MNKACEILFQYKDFTSFAKLHTDNKTNFCEIKKAVWEQHGEELVLTISADRFTEYGSCNSRNYGRSRHRKNKAGRYP